MFLLMLACGASTPADEVPADGAGDVGSEEGSRQSVVAVSFAGDQLSPETIQVKQGDAVTLNLESDRAGTFHIHGYDLEKEAVVGEVSEFRFEANATGRFRINFHGAATSEDSGASAGDMAGGHGATEHGPGESATPVSIDIAAEATDGGVLVRIDTEGWRWAPEEVNAANSDGAGHAHVYAGDVKLSRVYGPYHFIPDLEPGEHKIKVSLNTNDHTELTWQGEPLEATTSVIVPEGDATPGLGQGGKSATTVSDTPIMLEVASYEDPLGGYNLQVKAEGFEFSRTVDGSPASSQGYAELAINGESFNRLYVPWFQVPAQGEGEHTFTVALLNDAGMPYQYGGHPVAASVQVVEKTKLDHHGSGAGASTDHHGDGAGFVELEVGYLEVLP